VIRVLSGGAVQTFVRPLAESFAADTVEIEFQPMGKLVKTWPGLPGGRGVVTKVSKNCSLKAPGRARGVGVGVREGARARHPAPRRSRRCCSPQVGHLHGPQIGTSGKHVAEVLQSKISNKSSKAMGQGGQVAEAVARGEVELAIHQISEILPVKGVRFAGPLPPELQKFTVYVAALAPSSRAAGMASRFIEHLTSAQARGTLAQAGYTLPH
jgi:molybdate transport system substrate-binding protein